MYFDYLDSQILFADSFYAYPHYLISSNGFLAVPIVFPQLEEQLDLVKGERKDTVSAMK